MPIHFEDQEIASEVAGLRSALIVPCNLCPAVTVATRENRPFMRFFRSPVRSAPFEEYLEKQAKNYDAVIVLGCDSATETVRDVVPADVKVIEGMKTAGIMNGRMSLRLPGDLFFEGCKVVPISQQKAA